MNDAWAVDKRQVRRSFEETAAAYDAAAVLQNEVCRRMLARLDYIKVDPALVLDAGSGTGNAVAGLLARWPRARVMARRPWWRSLLDLRGPRLAAVCGDIEQLPLAAGCAGVVWSNLTVQWVNQTQRAFSEMHRVLAPGGLALFSTFGPDTLKELRTSFQDVDRHTHVHRFVDMHDIGDMLIACGFADPVMDMEVMTLTYDDVIGVMRDLKAIGAHNATLGRPASLAGKSLLAKVTRNYEAFRRDGKLPATFEVVYGHAWKPRPRVSPTGRPVIDIKPG
jgi:malonyl-CoA O-methyltransferase